MAARKERITAIPIVRALAMLGVISVHATSDAAVEMTRSKMYYGYTFFNIFFKYGTPTFILLSSFVLFYNYGGREMLQSSVLKKFYRNRLRYVIIPYILSSIFYFTFVHTTIYTDRSWDEMIRTFVTQILTGSAYTHLYFVFISIQFYLLFPLMLQLFRSRKITAWAIPLGLLLQWGFVVWNKYDLQVVSKGSIALSYMSYYFLGAYLGLNYERVRPWLSSLGMKGVQRSYRVGTALLWASWLVCALLHVQIWFWTRSTGRIMDSLVYELLWNVHTLLSAIVLMQLAFYLERRLPELLRRAMVRLGELSFGIYLVHPIFLAVYRQVPWHQGKSLLYPLYLAGGYMFALGMSWLVVSLAFSFIPFAWVGLGAPPSRSLANRRRSSRVSVSSTSSGA
ncbi:acyltransferase [Paenibacillus profundus]|uniref:Acyltransferase n=1 Tax=Paenibacillus profundus TaxID=1173085 RepID=A0ABS8YBL0_9BACL|nr:acyltransferase [Paenibacillus profundus]MCE5168259.1 acyltransferase [Paenibacillus profundus]